MMGIGAGYFFLVPVMEITIEEYGWRGSLLVTAGIGLQMVLFGMLIFPMKPIIHSDRVVKDTGPPDAEEPLEMIPLEEHMSLKMSLAASYLSVSLASINSPKTLLSRKYSFSSRYSDAEALRSKHQSQQDLNDDMKKTAFNIDRNESHSSFFTVKSSNHSFCKISSQGDLECGGNLLMNAHDSLPCIEESSVYIPQTEFADTTSFSRRRKITIILQKVLATFKLTLRKSLSSELFKNSIFWSYNFTLFFFMLGSINVFVYYKDLCTSLGLEHYYTETLMCIGVGDLCGRLLSGLVASFKFVNSSFIFTGSIFLMAISILLLAFANGPASFLTLSAVFGFSYGGGNILMAVTPATLFGKDQVLDVYGHVLFWGGLGALGGAPLAGWTVDLTGNYNAAISVASISCILGFCCMSACSLIAYEKKIKAKKVNG